MAAFATGALTLAVWKVSAQISYLQDKQQLEFQTHSEQRIATANESAQKAIEGQKALEAQTAEARLETERVRNQAEQARLQPKAPKSIPLMRMSAPLRPTRLLNKRKLNASSSRLKSLLEDYPPRNRSR